MPQQVLLSFHKNLALIFSSRRTGTHGATTTTPTQTLSCLETEPFPLPPPLSLGTTNM